MKTLLLLITLFACPVPFQSDLYNIHFTTLDGQEITMSSFTGKKIVIVPVNGTYADSSLLKKIDTLQKTSPDSLVAIAVPAIDLNAAINESNLVNLQNTLQLNIIISKPGKTAKSAGDDQHPLFKWLTRINENTHFDRDVNEAGQLFIISKNGTLYGILGHETSTALAMEVLNKPVIE